MYIGIVANEGFGLFNSKSECEKQANLIIQATDYEMVQLEDESAREWVAFAYNQRQEYDSDIYIQDVDLIPENKIVWKSEIRLMNNIYY